MFKNKPKQLKTILLLLTASMMMSAEANNTPLTSTSTTATIANNGIVAIVNNTAILQSDVALAIQQLQSQYESLSTTPPDSQQLRKAAINALIFRELQLDRVKRSGIRPKDALIDTRMAELAKSKGFSDLTSMQQSMEIEKAGSYALLRNKIIEELIIQSVRKQEISSRINISQQDIDAFLSSPEGSLINKNQYQTIHIRIPFPSDYNKLGEKKKQQTLADALSTAKIIQNILKLTNKNDNDNIKNMIANTQSNYPIEIQGGNMGYHTTNSLPSGLAKTIIKLDTNEVSEPLITTRGIDVIKLVDKKVTADKIVPQWHTRHILIPINQQQNDALAQLKINDLYEQLRQGADFAKLAATYSSDFGSAGKGGDLGWVNKGTMVSEFEEMMTKTVVSDFSTPFKTQFGWHILQVIDKRQYDTSNDLYQSLAREILFNRAVPQVEEDWIQELKSSAYVNILSP